VKAESQATETPRLELLAAQFDRDLRQILVDEPEVILPNGRRMRSTYFAEMLNGSMGLNVALRLLRSSPPSGTFRFLRKIGRLDLTVEHHVVKPEYAELFKDKPELIEAAQWRLDNGD
jgi:hypothetical protein